MINKEQKYRNELFELLKDNLDIDSEDNIPIALIQEVFLADTTDINVEEILKNYGKTTKMEDPIIHFYETFLAEYDPKLRKARGVNQNLYH